MLSTEHNLTTAQPMTASSISQQELACGTDTLPQSPSAPSLSSLQINASMQPEARNLSNAHNQREAKRLKYLYDPNSKEDRPNTTVAYIGKSDANFLPITSQSLPATINPTMRLPVYYQKKKTTDWHARNIFNPDIDRYSPTGLPLTDLYVYAVEANTENRRSVCQVKTQKEYASVEHNN